MSSIEAVSAIASKPAIAHEKLKKQSKAFSLCSKIWNAVIHIFLSIYNFFRNLFIRATGISQKEKDLLDRYVKMDTLPQHYAYKIARRRSPSSVQDDFVEEEDGTITGENLPPSLKVEPARKRMHDFFQDYGKLVGEIVFDKEVQPVIEKVQGVVGPAAEGLKGFVSTIAPVIGNDSNSKLKWRTKARKSFSVVVNGTLTRFKVTPDEIRKHISGIPMMPQDVLKKGDKELQDLMLDWITAKGSSDKKEGVVDLVTDKVREKLQGLIVDKQLQGLLDKVKSLQEGLPEIAQKALLQHINKFSKKIADRVVDLLEQVPFSEITDKVIGLVKNHAENFDVAEKEAVKKFKAAKAKGENVTQNEMHLKEFGRMHACHLHVRNVINKPEVNVEAFDELLAKTFYPKFAEEIFDLVLPQGFEAIYEELELPEDFQKFIDEIREMGKDIVNPNILKGISSVKVALVDAAKSYFFSLAEKKSKEVLANLLKNQFEKFINPARLNELMADAILPSLIEVRVESFIRGNIVKNAAVFAPLFQKALKVEDPNEILNQIKANALKLVIKGFSEFKMQDSGVSNEMIEKMIDPIMDDLHKFLVSRVEEIKKSKIKIDDKKIEEYIKYYFVTKEKTYAETEHKLYWEMFETVVFKLGEFGNQAHTACGWYKDAISGVLLSSSEIARTSYEGLSVLIVDSIRRNYLSRPKMEELIYSETAGFPSEQETKQKLERALDAFGRITYDGVMQSIATEKGSAAVWVIKPLIGRNATYVSQLVSKIYEKVLGRHKLFNYSIVFHFKEIMMSALAASAKTVEGQQSLELMERVTAAA
jgi:hypothetical protein